MLNFQEAMEKDWHFSSRETHCEHCLRIEKQNREGNAAKRWIDRHKERYGPLKIAILGDDLYACHSICASVAEAGMHFVLTCKDESHPWIAEQVRHAEPETYERREWNHRNHLVYRYKWAKGIENRAEGEKLPVNYLYKYSKHRQRYTF
jgi:nitrogenase molybdenum-iron protein alpha/beta subunit